MNTNLILAGRGYPFNGETTNINNEGDRVTPCEECIYSDSSRVIRFFVGSTFTGADDWGTIPYYFNKINQTYGFHI